MYVLAYKTSCDKYHKASSTTYPTLAIARQALDLKQYDDDPLEWAIFELKPVNADPVADYLTEQVEVL